MIKKHIHKMKQKKVPRALKAILGICSMVLASLFFGLVLYAQAFAANPDFFGQEAGNEFNYQGYETGLGPYTLQETVSLDPSTFAPTTTYNLVSSENSYGDEGNQWYEKGAGVLKLRGLRLWDDEVGWMTFKFSTGLPVAWNPMKQIGYHELNSTTMTIDELELPPGYTFNVSLDVTVLSKESVALSFDTLEAYKIKYILTISGQGLSDQFTLYQWLVPYIGNIKYMDDENEETLTSFKIGGGTITQNTDTDGDGLKDYQELAVYNTNRESLDTDGDKMPDGWEVTYELDPTVNDASSDKDNDGYSNLREYLADTDPSDPNSKPSIKAMPWIPLLLLDD